MYLDDFAFLVSGPEPTDLAVGGLTATNAVLTWATPQTDNAITGYAWQYRKAGDASWSAEATTAATSATIGGLTADTDYEFRVKTLYGGGASTYATLSFVTVPYVTLPYECGFEDGLGGWSRVDCIIDPSSPIYTDLFTGISSSSESVHAGEHGFVFSGRATVHQYLVSPRLPGNVPVSVAFQYKNGTASGGITYRAFFQVGHSTTTSDIDAFTWGNVIETSYDWRQFAQVYPARTKYVAVRWLLESSGRHSYYMYLDDFSFTEPAYTYADWAADNGVTGAWNATDALGVHNVFRYAFGKATGAFTNPPLLSISFENGQPVVHTPPLVNTEGYTFGILATDTLDGTGASATYTLNPSGRTPIPASDNPARFFRLRVTER